MSKNRLIFFALLALAVDALPGFASTLTNDTLIDVDDAAYEGQAIVVRGCILTVNGPHSFQSLELTNAAVLTHWPATNGAPTRRLDLTLTGDLTVDASSRIDVKACGYGASSGPGGGPSSVTAGGSGAGHGGLGAPGSANRPAGTNYDSTLAPTLPGSGGGNGYFSVGGAGGGAVRLNVGGTLRLEGWLTADGGNGYGSTFGGGGAGGSVALTVGTLTGYGTLSANGGAGTGGNGGGGAGGCLALRFTNNSFAGSLQARGGAGLQYGGAGTLFTKAATQAMGDLLVDNGGHAGQFTPLTTPVPFNLTIANRATVYPLGALTNGHLTIKSNGLLTHLSEQTDFTLTVLSNLVIEAGGCLEVSGQGFAPATGPGAGASVSIGGGGGGGHGGVGGSAAASGGGGYDSLLTPAAFGSGGGNGFLSSGGTGGGALRLTVAGTLQVDGALAADGRDGLGYIEGGGGAGGSLYLTTASLSGQGAIRANGGAGWGGGGGGGAGGRIAIYYGTNSFTGTLTAYGGAGLKRGGAGTVFTKASTDAQGLTSIHNGGNSGGVTRLNNSFWPAGLFFDLTLAGAATVIPDMPLTFASLLVTSGATVTHDPGQPTLYLTTLGDARIDAGSAINADGLGYGSASGPGAGANSVGWGGGGAGYGGTGGATTNGAAGGPTYGSASQPLDLGSGGGNGYQSRGGAGGGAIRLEVGGFCYVYGTVTANGARGTDYIYGGGGSGGSIFLTAGVLTGTGTIAANGALGTGAGGGGGGRVALYAGMIVGLLNPPTMAGGITGTGSNTNLNGRAGTVFTSNSPPSLQVVSLSPSGTVLQPVSSVDVNFNLAIDAATFTPVDVLVTTPSGPLPGGQITVTPVGGPRFRIGFPVQSTPGVYQLQVGPHVQDVFGREMDQNGDGVPGQVTNDIYYGSFSIANSRILAGTVRQTNGTPVADVILQAGTFATARTGSNGTYTLLVPVGWSGTVTPTRTGCTLAPATRSYTNVSANQVGQDYALTIAFAPTLTAVPQGAQLRVEWPSIVGILYQLQTSPDLVTWGKAGPPLAGNGAVLSWLFDTTGSPLEFYRVLATN